jgi:integrase/recombinase XerD
VQDLRDAVSFHQLVLGANGASEHTHKQYLDYEVRFLEFLRGRGIKPALNELRPDRVREFLVWYRTLEHPRRTRGGEVAVRAAADVLKRLGNLLEENEYVEVNPLRKLKRPRITKFTRTPFSDQELSAMWGACFRTRNPARDEALFLLLLDTGVRIGEACSLKLEKLNLTERTVTVMGKGRRERTISIQSYDDSGRPRRDGGRVVRALARHLSIQEERWANPLGYVFLARDGHQLTAEGGNDVIKRVAAASDVEDAYPHRFRHTFCTWYLTVHPGDEMGLRRIVGHISTGVLADYVHLAQTTIDARRGRASLAESVLGPHPVVTQLQSSPIAARRRAPLTGYAGPTWAGDDVAGVPPVEQQTAPATRFASPRGSRRLTK